MYHTRPRAEQHSHFYEVMCKQRNKLRQAFPDENLHGWPMKRLCLALLDTAQPLTQQGEESKTKHRISVQAYQGNRADIEWQLAHAALPVRTRLHRMGYSRSDRCVECGRIKSHKHIFHNCFTLWPCDARWRVCTGFQGWITTQCIS